MATKITQTTVNPTAKLNAATIAAAMVSVVGLVLRNVAEGWYDPDVMAAILPIAVFLAGYLVKDDANVVVKLDDGSA